MSSPSTPTDVPKPEPSLAPACLVVCILALVAGSIFLLATAWMLMGRQSERAELAIQSQLIPWVENAPLADSDKEQVLARLDVLVRNIHDQAYDQRQLLRLHAVLSDSPLLQWGVIQSLLERTEQSTLTEAEKRSVRLECQRLLRMAAQGDLGMHQMEFIVQRIAAKDRKSGMLTYLPNAADADLREFLQRAKSTTDRAKIPAEPFEISVAEALSDLLQKAIDAPESN